MPVAAESTAALGAQPESTVSESIHDSYIDENGNVVTFPVADGTLPVTPTTVASPATTEKKGLLDRLKKAEETTTAVTSTVTTTITTTAATTTDAESSVEKTDKKTEVEKSGKTNEYEYAYAGLNPEYAVINDSNWNLMLINRDYILPDGYTVSLASSVAGDPSSCKLDYRVAPHYNEMYLAAKEDGIILTPVSGYRSMDRQRNNLNNKIAYYQNQGFSKVEATQKAVERILPPGTSEHNAGMAMDIITADSTAGFQYTKEYKWLDEHAAEYGFILRYPENKVNVTKIIYEPWHWRYVGVSAAKAMKASGQCLEEYLGKA